MSRRIRTALGVIGGLLLSASAPAFAAKPKMLVQDLVPRGVEPHEAAVISTAACQAFARSAAHDVLCGEDVRNMMRFGAMTAAFDGACADEQCYANIGKAMKARYVVSGSVSKLGGVYVLALSVFDTEEARSVGRGEVKADSLEKLHLQVGEAAGTVLGR